MENEEITEIAKFVSDLLQLGEEKHDAVSTLLDIYNHFVELNKTDFHNWADQTMPLWKHQLIVRHRVKSERIKQ